MSGKPIFKHCRDYIEVAPKMDREMFEVENHHCFTNLIFQIRKSSSFQMKEKWSRVRLFYKDWA